MSSKKVNNKNSQWKEALNIVHSISELNQGEQIEFIKKLNIDKEIKAKTEKILLRLKAERKLLEKGDHSVLFKVGGEEKTLVGQEIDGYKILKLIGQGGMSNVYKVVDKESAVAKTFALKTLSPYLYSEKTLELFKREQYILSKLNHPSIIAFHKSGKAKDGTQYFLMEYISEAQNILDYCKTKNLSPKEIVKKVIEVANVCNYAHNNLVIHRDIKAENILVDGLGNTKVIDFGIGQYNQDESEEPTKVFTLDIASPEQILGKNVTIQTDVFSLGALLLQLLVKKKPLPEVDIFKYEPGNDTKHVQQLLGQSGLDSDLKNIILTAMHLDTSKRYLNMASFAEDLKNWLQKRPIIASPDSRLYRFKKLISRNPLTSVLCALVLVSVMLSTVLVYHFASRTQVEIERVNKTINFLTHIFEQADSFNSATEKITLIEALDRVSNIPLAEVGGDKQLKVSLHKKLSEIFTNMALDQRAVSQINFALAELQSSPKIKQREINDLKLRKAFINLSLNKTGESIALSNEVISNLESLPAHNYNEYSMAYSALLKAHSNPDFDEFFDIDKTREYKNKLLNYLENNFINENASKLTALDALTVSAMNEKSLTEAIKYQHQSLKILEAEEKEKSAGYYILKSNLAYSYVLTSDFKAAEGLFNDLILQVSAHDPDNYFLSRVYENYASLMFSQNKPESGFDALSKSVEHSMKNNSLDGKYQSLAKRAMYYSRYNQFVSGLEDQMQMMPIMIKQYGAKNPSTIRHLVNLSLMLYSVNQAEMANRVIKKAITTAQNNHFQERTIAVYYMVSGLSNWHAKLTSLAKEDLVQAKTFNNNTIDSKIRLLQFLVSGKLTSDDISWLKEGAQQHLDLYQRVFMLLSMQKNDASRLWGIEHVMRHCVLDEAFRKMKLISVKKSFLEVCQVSFERNKTNVPDGISSALKAIKLAERASLEIDTVRLNKAIDNILSAF